MSNRDLPASGSAAMVDKLRKLSEDVAALKRRPVPGITAGADAITWRPVAFQPNYVNYDTTQYGPCYVGRDALGNCRLRGLYACTHATTLPNPVTYLDPDVCPDREQIFLSFASWGVLQLRIQIDGTVTNVLHVGAYTGSNFLSFAGITWWAP